ncbi:MAG TPA: hypothetical protein VHX88_21205 [Solirubrobacteraceae bacterium]|jgi:hypothetical protein|nr:hypothetical protein [Solirubrobacteraceae bacterium]
MTIARFLTGVLLLIGTVGPAALTARSLQRRFSAVSGPAVVLVDAVLALSVVLVAAELLGLVGLMRPAALVPLLVLVALISVRVWRPAVGSAAPAERAQLSLGLLRQPASLAAAAAVVIVCAQWLLGTISAYDTGMLSYDTLWYHMPFAADFAQTGSVTKVFFTQPDPLTAYYPANSELLHGVLIGLLGGDAASPSLNLLWLLLALLAAWCIGQPWGRQRETLVAVALALSLPALATGQGGHAANDIVGLTPLLVAAALLARQPLARFDLGVAGLALGLAVGTKVTVLVPATALLVIAPLGYRRRAARPLGLLVGGTLVTGGWWYLRNLIDIHDPFGIVHLHLGPLKLGAPASPLASTQSAVASYIGHSSLWSSRFIPGLHSALGVGWPVLLVLAITATGAGLAAIRDPRLCALALTAAAAGLSYLLLPTGATGLLQGYALFATNLRYLMPALALGLALGPIALGRLRPRLVPALTVLMLALLVATQLSDSLWRAGLARHAAYLLVCAAVVVVLLSAPAAARRLVTRRATVTVLAVGVLAVLVVGWAVEHRYYDRRYEGTATTSLPFGSVYRWAQTVARKRIADYGDWEQYPLYGKRDANVVRYLGQKERDGGYAPIATCAAWKQILNRGRYQYLVLEPTAGSPAEAWTAGDPALSLIVPTGPHDGVFAIHGRLNPALCG